MIFHAKLGIKGNYLYVSHTLFILYLEGNHTLFGEKLYIIWKFSNGNTGVVNDENILILYKTNIECNYFRTNAQIFIFNERWNVLFNSPLPSCTSWSFYTIALLNTHDLYIDTVVLGWKWWLLVPHAVIAGASRGMVADRGPQTPRLSRSGQLPYMSHEQTSWKWEKTIQMIKNIKRY